MTAPRPAPDPRSAPRFAVAAAGLLFVLKAVATVVTTSLALGAAAVDSLFDLAVSAVNWQVLRMSSRPPDADHAWGHGKFENVAAMAQGLLLGAAGVALVVASVERFATGGAPRRSGVGIAVLAASIVVSLLVARRLRRAAAASGSPALAADSLHYASDLWVNGAALVALLVVHWTGWWPADPLLALLVSGWVFHTAFRLLRGSLAALTDRALPEPELERIRRVVAGFAPDVVGLHDLRTRTSGSQRFVEFHLEIPRDTSFERAHELMVAVLRAVEAELPRSKVTVHGDPV